MKIPLSDSSLSDSSLAHPKLKRPDQTNTPLHFKGTFSTSIWLDTIPSDVSQRIAFFVSFGKPAASLFRLAELSSVQRSAVAATLSYKCTPQCDGRPGDEGADPCIPHVTVFSGRIVDIDLGRVACSSWVNVLKSPTLKRAVMYDEPEHLRAILRAKSIRDLNLTLMEDEFPYLLVLDVLNALDLTKLTFRCEHQEEALCPLKRLCSPIDKLSCCCNNLLSLGLDCVCYDMDSSHPIWEVVPTISTLEELAISSLLKVPDFIKSLLCNLKAVVCRKGSSAPGTFAVHLAQELRESVTAVRDAEFDEEEDVLRLYGCFRLAEMEVHSYRGSEQLLPDLLLSLPALSSLDMRWTEGVTPEDCLIFPNKSYARAVPGALLHAVRKAPKLTPVQVYAIAIDKEEVESILSTLGNRLQTFKTSIACQTDAPLDRLEAVIDILRAHNPQLQSFGLHETAPDEPIELASRVDFERLWRQRRRIINTVQQWQRSVRSLDLERIKSFLFSLRVC